MDDFLEKFGRRITVRVPWFWCACVRLETEKVTGCVAIFFHWNFECFFHSFWLWSGKSVLPLKRKKKISEKCLSLSQNLGRRSRPSPKSLLMKTQKHCKQDGHVRHHRRHPPAHHDRCVPPVVGSRPGARSGWCHGLDDGALPPPLVPRLLCARIPACGSSVQNNDPRP